MTVLYRYVSLKKTPPCFCFGSLLFYFLLILTGLFEVHAGSSPKLKGGYSYIAQIKSPLELLSGLLPNEYAVPVKLSGTIAAELKQVLDTVGISMPEFEEVHNKNEEFRLRITNNDYASQTRDLLSGILNPIEMTDVILRAILQYKDKNYLHKLEKETRITQKRKKTDDGRSLVVITLRPAGKRFGYEYKDNGAYIHETWLTQLSLAIDINTMLASELSLEKYRRVFNSDQQKKPEPQKAIHRRKRCHQGDHCSVP